jgi:glucose/arabinose dehydrogenase
MTSIPRLARRNRSARPDPHARLRCERLESRDCPAAVLDPNLAVRTAVAGLDQPTGIAFLGPNDMLITEKATGKVQHVVNGVVGTPAIDLAVNSASERGLLSIELHPDFAHNHFVYLYWTQSSTGADSTRLSDVPLLGNRVDRFVWNGSTLTFDRNIIMLHAFQQDGNGGNPSQMQGNHDGGKIKFGPDGKLYVQIGDNGRRGEMQNIPDGPFGNGQPDDQFGGPEPDPVHTTGVVFRLNDDGSTPRDNPFFRAGAELGGDVGASLQKVFAYGVRNGFGMAFDPYSGRLWDAENGDDSFSEINQIDAGADLGWVQVMGPVSRVAQFKAIETDNTTVDPVTHTKYFGLQQDRWSPFNIADTPEEALARMFKVFQDVHHFTADLSGSQEVPATASGATASLELQLTDHGTLRFKLKATSDITGMTASHLHLGGRGQNGSVVVPLALFSSPRDFKKGDTIAQGELTDANVVARPGFTPSIAELVRRMLEQRVYVNIHTVANPAGDIRGQVDPQGHQVSHYRDPELSWKFEVAPTGLGFMKGGGLGDQYEGSMFVGSARTFLDGGFLFRMDLTENRKHLDLHDPRLADGVADNLNKFDITESESLLFGTGFGIVTEIETGKNGNLFVVSLTDGKVYEIFRQAGANQNDDNDDNDDNDKGRDHGDGRGGRRSLTAADFGSVVVGAPGAVPATPPAPAGGTRSGPDGGAQDPTVTPGGGGPGGAAATLSGGTIADVARATAPGDDPLSLDPILVG